jgi:GIY-YIG catalytic domain/NUMOD3 motif
VWGIPTGRCPSGRLRSSDGLSFGREKTYCSLIHETTFIYALVDPRNGEIRYVGKADKPERRWKIHLQHVRREKSHKNSWLLELLNLGLKPGLETLDEVPSDCWQIYEESYIRIFRAIGLRMTNTLDGGEGFSGGERHPRPQLGKKLSPELIAKQVEARKGVIRTPEWCARISAAHKGKPKPPWKPGSEDRRRRASELMKGNKFRLGLSPSVETREKISRASKGRTISDEQKAKASARLKGIRPSPQCEAARNASRKGTKHSPKTLAKMSASHKKQWERIRLAKLNSLNDDSTPQLPLVF